MFDIGFLELLICGIIALLVLGPERLPTAARAAGRWVGAARRMVSQFTSELDSQLKADELREQLRKAGDVGLDDVKETVRTALDDAKKFEHLIRTEGESLNSVINQNHTPAGISEKSSEKGKDEDQPVVGQESLDKRS
ncbi:MAG TPA: Sec-independent protein translocase protein TatB [Marinobacter sp.]|nr:Sec-independent protein translocase protein TatB [Marinobacter sp.]